MKDLTRNIGEIVREILPGEQYFIVDISIKGGHGKKKLIVMIDGDAGVDISVCSEINHKLSVKLDEMDLVEGSYTLEVTSPGLDTPLSTNRQYVKNIGRNIKVIMSDNSQIKGRLTHVMDEGITVKKESGKKKMKRNGDETFIRYNDIKKTNVLVAFK